MDRAGALGDAGALSAPPGHLSLWRNLSWISAGRAVFAVSQWGVLAVLAKLSTPAAVGQFGLALAVCAPVFKLSNLGLRRAQASDVRREHPFASYWRLRALCSVAALLAVGLAAAGAGQGAETALVIALVGVNKAIGFQSEVCYGHFQCQERMDRVARSLLLRGPLSLLLLAGGVAATGALAVGVVGQLVASMLVLALHDLRLARRSAGVAAPPEGPGIWRLARETWPLGVAGALLALQQNAPSYFVVEQLGLEALGYFAAMLYVLVAGNQFAMALGHSAVARLARHFASGRTGAFRRLLLAMAGFVAVAGGAGLVAAWLSGAWILQLLYAPDYAVHADAFVLVMGAALFRYLASLFQFGLAAARRFGAQALHQAAVAACALAAAALLVAPYGLRGAALAALVTFALDFAGSAGLCLWFSRGRRRRAGS